MELLTLKIHSDFRNLKGLRLAFSNNIGTYVLIGNNGSGKSSILEAISSIFKTLYYDDALNFEFRFTFAYSIDEHRVSISFKNADETPAIKVDDNPTTIAELRRNYLPNRIVCNYSGEDFRIRENYYTPVWEAYENKLKKVGGDRNLQMHFVDKEVWKIMLLVMLAERHNIEAFDTFLSQTLGINSVGSVFLTIDNATLATWSDNTVTYFMRQLAAQIQPDGTLALNHLNPTGIDAAQLYYNLCYARKLIKDLQIVFNGDVNSEYLSEGEKKLMSILFILEVIADEKTLVLLDEPDSHIHVARKAQLKEYFDQAANRKNILTSHSPTLTAKFDAKSIIMLDKGTDGHAQVIKHDKQAIVSQLTDGIWTLQQQNIFLASNDDIILVEGWTDEVFLSYALEVFKKEGRFADHNYCYLPCNGASGVEVLKGKFSPKPNQKMYCLLDNDMAGWKGINSIFQKSKPNLFDTDNFGKAKKKDGIWFAPFPRLTKKAVDFNIEDYFGRYVFLRYVMSFKNLNEIKDKDWLKREIAKDCKAGKLKDTDFKRFDVVFKLIEEIKAAELAGRDSI